MKTAKDRAPRGTASPAALIDARIAELGDWRGDMLARVRTLIKRALPGVIQEWKWRRLEGNTPRAIDLHDGQALDEVAFIALVRAAAALNAAPRGR